MVTLILFLVIAAAIVLYSSFSWGLVLYKFWYWFLLPVFPDLPEITYILAVGLMLFIGLFHNQTHTVIKEEYRKQGWEVSGIFFAPWITLIIGWFLHLIIS